MESGVENPQRGFHIEGYTQSFMSSEGSLLLRTANLFILCNGTPKNHFHKVFSHPPSSGYKNWLAWEDFDTGKFSKTM